jgi:hypothetical protein
MLHVSGKECMIRMHMQTLKVFLLFSLALKFKLKALTSIHDLEIMPSCGYFTSRSFSQNSQILVRCCYPVAS